MVNFVCVIQVREKRLIVTLSIKSTCVCSLLSPMSGKEGTLDSLCDEPHLPQLPTKKLCQKNLHLLEITGSVEIK